MSSARNSFRVVRLLSVVTFGCVGVLSMPAATSAGPINPGDDVWMTPCGGTYVDLNNDPIPADFFGPGSDPLGGVIDLGGVPLAISPPPAPPLAADTVVRRPAPTSPTFDCGGSETIPIEIVALSLSSCSPITVTYNGGGSPELWDVAVCLDPPQSTGTMTVNHECQEGGTYSACLPVRAQLTFTRSSPPGGPFTLTRTETFSSSGSWTHANSAFVYTLPAGAMFDTDCDNVPDAPTNNTPVVDFYPGLHLTGCTSCTGPPPTIRKPLTPEQARWAAHGVFPPNQDKPPTALTEACCFADGSCIDARVDPSLGINECTLRGGTKQGPGTRCSSTVCSGGPPPDPCPSGPLECPLPGDPATDPCGPLQSTDCVGSVNELCQPVCVDYDPSTGTTTVTDCSCLGTDECHVDVAALPPVCTSGCPAPLVCVQTDTIDPGTGIIHTCCTCEQTGACCDGTTGICTDDVPESQCVNSLPGDQFTWYKDLTCTDAGVICEEHRGACCDHAQPGGVCVDGVTESGCLAASPPLEQPEWFKDLTCTDVEVDGLCDEHTGACCDGCSGVCTNNVAESACVEPAFCQPSWTKGVGCADVVCDEHTGACCDNATGNCLGVLTESQCLATPPPAQPKFFKDLDCSQVTCKGGTECVYDNFFPTPPAATYLSASQKAVDFPFWAETAEDFTLTGDPANDCVLDGVRFAAFHSFAGVSPANWDAVKITIYDDGGMFGLPKGPGGEPLQDGTKGHIEYFAGGIKCQVLKVSMDKVTWIDRPDLFPNSYEVTVSNLKQFNCVLEKNHKYWIAISPEMRINPFGQIFLYSSMFQVDHEAQLFHPAGGAPVWTLLSIQGNVPPTDIAIAIFANKGEQVGACCDGCSGLCTNGVPQSQCVEPEFCQPSWTKNTACSDVACEEHTGACCDRRIADPALRCLDNVPESECPIDDPTQKSWTKDTLCANLDPPCTEHTGACCDHSLPGGQCVSGVAESACVPPADVVWFADKPGFDTFMLASGKALKGIEDFEESNIPDGGKQILHDVLQGNVPNVDPVTGFGFPNGLTEKNLVIQTNITPGPNPPDPNPYNDVNALYVGGTGFLGSNSKKVGEDLFLQGIPASIDLIFTEPDKTGVGFELSRFAGWGTGAGWDITVYDKNDDQIAKFKVSGPIPDEPSKTFVGVWSSLTIGRINIFDQEPTPGPEAIDNIQMWVGQGTQIEWFKGEDCVEDGGTVDCAEHTGACCDGCSGVCTPNVPESACVAPAFCQPSWTKDLDCSAVECVEHTGACCDRRIADPALRCLDNVPESECPIDDPTQKSWTKDTLCADLDPPCTEHTGACCDHAQPGGVCIDGVPESQCVGSGGEDKAYKISVDWTIPDGDPAGVRHEFFVPDHGVIADLDVDLLVQHTQRSDLTIWLRKKSDDGAGTTVILTSQPDGASDHIGDPSTFQKVFLDDEAAEPFDGVPGDSPTGFYQPSQPLSEFDGFDKFGLWSITVVDNFANGEIGIFIQWSLNFVNDSGQTDWFKDMTCADVEAAGLCDEHTGACCDKSQPGGVCVSGVPESQCNPDGDPQIQWYKGELCVEDGGTIDCLEHTGACCDGTTGNCQDGVAESDCPVGANPGGFGTCQDEELCSDPCPAYGACTTNADCGDAGVCLPDCIPSFCVCDLNAWACTDDCNGRCAAMPDQYRWEKGTLCDELVPACTEHTGACCDKSQPGGVCVSGVPESQCNPNGDPQIQWYKDELCVEDGGTIDCPEHTGACCHGATGLCDDGVVPGDCAGALDQWFKDELCDELNPPCAQEDCGPTDDETGCKPVKCPDQVCFGECLDGSYCDDPNCPLEPPDPVCYERNTKESIKLCKDCFGECIDGAYCDDPLDPDCCIDGTCACYSPNTDISIQLCGDCFGECVNGSYCDPPDQDCCIDPGGCQCYLPDHPISLKLCAENPPVPPDECQPRCVNYDLLTGQTTVIDCGCAGPNDCRVELAGVTPGRGAGNDPCVVPDNGQGTVSLPPEGCDYLSPEEVHAIIDDLPPGVTIELATIHERIICEQGGDPLPWCPPSGLCEDDGGNLGGKRDCFDSQLAMSIDFKQDGILVYHTDLTIPNVKCAVDTGPRTEGDPIQSFPTDMFHLEGHLFGDPDFDELHIVAGSDFGLPSSGQTTLTDRGDGSYNVDSFFDVSYRIDFVGAAGGFLQGASGSSTGTIHMATGNIPDCIGRCPPGMVCERTITDNADGTIDVCCDCVEPPCSTDADCYDGDECTVNTCNAGTCESTPSVHLYPDISPPPSNPAATFPCDAEERARMGDGFLTMLDVMCAFNAMNAGAPYTACPCLDVSPCGGDGFVTMLDVMYIFNTMNAGSGVCVDPC